MKRDEAWKRILRPSCFGDHTKLVDCLTSFRRTDKKPSWKDFTHHCLHANDCLDEVNRRAGGR